MNTPNPTMKMPTAENGNPALRSSDALNWSMMRYGRSFSIRADKCLSSSLLLCRRS